MQDDEKFEVVPNSDFTISRTAHVSNKSDYYINDRKSNFTEVTDLLKGKGIDLDNNRFLILQGEVEQISMMKPKGSTEHETGLLEYLEDIIGTDKYIPQIEEGLKQLEHMNEKRQSMLARVRIAEKERDALEGEKAAAEAYLSKETEALTAHKILAAVYIKEAQGNVEHIDINISKLEQKLDHEREKFKQYNDCLKEHEEKYNAIAAQHGSIQKELDNAQEEFKNFEKKDIKYREDIKHLKSKIERLETKAAKDKARLVDLERQAAAEEVPTLRKHAAELTLKLSEAELRLEALVDGCRDEVEELRQQLQGVKAKLAPWESKMTEVQSRIDVATSERDMLVKSHQDTKKRFEDAKINLKAALETARNKAAQVKDMETKVGKHRQDVEKAHESLATASAEVEQLEARMREVRGRVGQKRAEASSKASQGAVVNALMDAKAKGIIGGIHGRLGDLGAIDAKYDVAVSTSCAALDYIVVDTTSAAQRCVEYLRQRQAGVATFLILEKQAHLAAAAAAATGETPEGVPRLFDLVRCKDQQLKVAFYYSMRDTVVANDLEQASRISYGQNKRWRRVVTIAGEMINESGTMSGGGGKPRGGRMCLGNAAPKAVDAAASAQELEHAEKELQKLTMDISGARAIAADASSLVKIAERSLADLETGIPKTKMEADAAQARAADLEGMLGGLEIASSILPEEAERLRALGSEIAQESASLEDLRSKSEGLTDQAKMIEGAIEKAGGDPMRRQRALVAKLQGDIAAAEADASRKQAAASTAVKQLEKLRKDSEKSTAEHSSMTAQLESTRAEFKALEEAAFHVVDLVQMTQQTLAGKEAELLSIKEEFEAKQKEVGIIRSVEVDIAAEIDSQKSALKEETHKLTHWTEKSQEYTLTLAQRLNVEPCPVSTEELETANVQELQYRITMLEEEMGTMNVNLEAIEAWRLKDADHQTRVIELEQATVERDSVRKGHEELRKKRLDEFMGGFNSITLKLKEMYQMITLGGDAELELVDSLDPFSEGILFSVRPPKKSWKNIANLSGGEKTLSSLSLVFALHHYKPTPLYVMDEIDAALDFKNVSIVGHYIKERTKNAQFVIISLRNNMFELADRLVGIYKTDNATKSVAINPGQFAVGASKACVPVSSPADQEQVAPVVEAA